MLFLANSPICLIGLISPTVFVIYARDITFVFFVTILFKDSKVNFKSLSSGTYFILNPISFWSSNHGSTLLACSAFDNITSSFLVNTFFINPKTIIFKLSVVPFVNTISSLLKAFINLATLLLVPSYNLSTIKLLS